MSRGRHRSHYPAKPVASHLSNAIAGTNTSLCPYDQGDHSPDDSFA